MAESTKVTIPSEVAEAIECVWGDIMSGIISATEPPVKHGWLTNWNELDDNYQAQQIVLWEYYKKHPKEYVAALVDGYEVERSPYDDIRELYGSYDARSDYAVGARSGIIHTLSIFGIAVEGINDKEAK